MNEATGLAPDMLEMVVDTLEGCSSSTCPNERILELDANDEFPTDVVRELLSPDVGMHLMFLPEEVGWHGRRRPRHLPRLRGDGARWTSASPRRSWRSSSGPSRSSSAARPSRRTRGSGASPRKA